jgi:hypothetical protein
VRLHAPAGWRFAEADGLRLRMNGRQAVRSGRLTQDTVVRVRLARERGDDLWSRLEDGPT